HREEEENECQVLQLKSILERVLVFLIDEMDMKRVYLDITVCDYDLIGGGDPIGKVKLGWNQQKEYKPGFKHFKEVLENPRRPHQVACLT
ncbi:Synaptotagmin 1, partial [Caligus rogercresseyi]